MLERFIMMGGGRARSQARRRGMGRFLFDLGGRAEREAGGAGGLFGEVDCGWVGGGEGVGFCSMISMFVRRPEHGTGANLVVVG